MQLSLEFDMPQPHEIDHYIAIELIANHLHIADMAHMLQSELEHELVQRWPFLAGHINFEAEDDNTEEEGDKEISFNIRIDKEFQWVIDAFGDDFQDALDTAKEVVFNGS